LRRTLETLLASRLSDDAILLGKLCASVLYAWVLMIGSLGLGRSSSI
jgi:ABC-2 type transport system permease protein